LIQRLGRPFYPDFILWVIEDKDNKQRIAFIDPHGLRMARGGFNDPKIRLHKELEELSKKLCPASSGTRVYLTSFIISTTSYEEIKHVFGIGNHAKEEFYQNHVLFQEDYLDCIDRLLKIMLGSKCKRCVKSCIDIFYSFFRKIATRFWG